MVLSVLEPAPVRVPVGVGHVPDAVPLAVLVPSDVSVAVGPVVLPGAVEQAVSDLSYIPVRKKSSFNSDFWRLAFGQQIKVLIHSRVHLAPFLQYIVPFPWRIPCSKSPVWFALPLGSSS